MSRFKELLEEFSTKRQKASYILKAQNDTALQTKMLDVFKCVDKIIYFIMSQDIQKDFSDAHRLDLKDFLKASEVMYHFRKKLGDKAATEKFAKEQIWAIKEIGKQLRGE